ncbi:MAG: hypothetical protein R3C05_05535 [Pirellulaceae bacterium]
MPGSPRPLTYATQQPAFGPQQQGYAYQPAQPYRTISQHGGQYESVPAPVPNQVEALSYPVNPPQPEVQHHGYSSVGHGTPNPGCSTCNQPMASDTHVYSQPNIYVQAAETPGGSCGVPYESMGACSAPVYMPGPVAIQPRLA